MEAENGKKIDPAPSEQIPQAFAFWFLNVNPPVASVTSVAEQFRRLSFSNNPPDAVAVVDGLHDFPGLPAIADGINLAWLGGRNGKLTPLILPLLFSNCLGDCRGVDPQLLRYVRHRHPILSTQNPCNL